MALQEIFLRADVDAAGFALDDNISIARLLYADDAALLDVSAESMSARLTAVEKISLEDADMTIARQKTFMLWFRKLFEVTETTEEEVNDLDLEFRCEHCEHFSCDVYWRCMRLIDCIGRNRAGHCSPSFSFLARLFRLLLFLRK